MRKFIGLVAIAAAAISVYFALSRSPGPDVAPERQPELKLRWDRAADSRVEEYRIYVRTELENYTFEAPTAVVPSGVTDWAVNDLPAGRYFAVVTAATATEESEPTEEIEFEVP